jgi:DNA-directed RNA polymerase subunit omega
MRVVNSEVEPGEAPIVNSRYSIVMATAKRARQLIDEAEPMVDDEGNKPLSTAVEELYQGKIKILTEEEARKAREAALAPVIDLGMEEELPEVSETEEVEETPEDTEE